MNKLKMQSTDAMVGNIAKIATLFPQCVTETADKIMLPDGTVRYESRLIVDFDKLREELSAGALESGEERYQFTWPDKRAAVRLANTPTTKTLRPCREESVDFDNTQNLYIEGDNLDVLKALRETYLGKVKMIYIDPPYNTGNDFVYNDAYSVCTDEEEDRNGFRDEDGNQTLWNYERNTSANGRFHTDWLNMIYPRLKVARDLISDDGVIFISIDDNEIDNLRKVCNEIFGASNLIVQITVNRASEVATELIIQKHEYCLVYAKQIQKINLCGNTRETISRGTVGNEDQTMPVIEFPAGLKCFNISDGIYNSSRQISGSRENVEVLSPFVVENGMLKFPVKLKARWRSSNDMRNFFANKCSPTVAKINGIITEIYFDGDRLMPYIRKVVHEKIQSVYMDNRRGSTDLEHLELNYFDYPKSVDYIAHLVSFFTKKQDIVLDFFSGSATTAHAVMKSNAISAVNRKFIMVQLPEILKKNSAGEKAGFKNICDMAKERIRRAGKKVKEEAGLQGQDLDIGFRVLKLDSSNMEDVYYTPQDFNEQKLFNENVKADRTSEDLLFQVMLDLGIELSAKIEAKEIAGKEVHFVNDNFLVACFDRDVNETTIIEIAKMKPAYFVMRDASVANDNVMDNFEQIFKHYSEGTECRML